MSEMKAEPEVIYNGKSSDASEHIPMLSNQAANARADGEAIKQARELGLTPEEIKLLGMAGPFDPDTLKDED